MTWLVLVAIVMATLPLIDAIRPDWPHIKAHTVCNLSICRFQGAWLVEFHYEFSRQPRFRRVWELRWCAPVFTYGGWMKPAQ